MDKLVIIIEKDRLGDYVARADDPQETETWGSSMTEVLEEMIYALENKQ